MHFKALLISTLLFSLPIVRAGTIANFNAVIQSLQEQAENDDGDVKALNTANALINAKGVADDLADLASGIDTALENGQGTQATNDPGTEEDVVGAFNQFSVSTARYMNDLAAKVNDLTLSGQKTSIQGSLNTLYGNYFNLVELAEGLVTAQTYKDDIAEDSSNTFSSIRQTRTAFE